MRSTGRVLRGRGFRVLAAVLLCLAVSFSVCAKVTVVQIPVVVNLYPGCSTTEKEARDAIGKASGILGQAGLKLVVVKVNKGADCKGDDGSGGGTAGDGKLTRGERGQVRAEGGKELGKLPNHRGIKICFVGTPSEEGSASTGVSVQEDPTIVVKNSGSSELTGQTIAHEIGHVVGLGSGHKIDGATWADPGGHAPDQPGKSGRGNLMTPKIDAAATHLTQAQIDEMRKRAYDVGKCATQWKQAYPALKDKLSFGQGFDSIGDQGQLPSVFDLTRVTLVSTEDSSTIDVEIGIGGYHQAVSGIAVDYTLAFNVDGDAHTGMEIGHLPGVDWLVRIAAYWDWTGPTQSLLRAYLYDPIQGTYIDLPHSWYAIEHEFDVGDAHPAATTLFLIIPRQLLPFPEREVPVVATAGSGLAVHDLLYLTYDPLIWSKDPEIATFGTGVPAPGEAYRVDLHGLAPDSAFTLTLDDLLVLEGRLDSSGSYSGSFVFPRELDPSQPHFLTAQDETGEFGYSLTCPSTWPDAWPVEQEPTASTQ